MKRLMLTMLVFTFSSLPALASTGAQKLINELSNRSYNLELQGEGCSLNLRYNSVTAVSDGGPVLVEAEMENGDIEIKSKVDIEKAVVSADKVLLVYKEGIAVKSTILITVDSEGKPVSAVGKARVFFKAGDINCKLN